jgi:hypothetical protein
MDTNRSGVEVRAAKSNVRGLIDDMEMVLDRVPPAPGLPFRSEGGI